MGRRGLLSRRRNPVLVRCIKTPLRATSLMQAGGTHRREAKGLTMADTLAAIAGGIFVIGIATGIVAIASIGIKREEREFERTGRVRLAGRAPGRVSGRARALTGLYVRQRAGADPAASRYQDTLI